jgi:hypothetical protein
MTINFIDLKFVIYKDDFVISIVWRIRVMNEHHCLSEVFICC